MLRQYLLILPLVLVSSVTLARPGTARVADGPVLPRIITACVAPVEFSNDMQQVAYDSSGVTQSGRLRDINRAIKLVKTGSHYGIRYADRTLDNEKLVNASADQRPVHLVLKREDGPEHFMFMIDEQGTGELLWSTGAVSTLTSCSASTTG